MAYSRAVSSWFDRRRGMALAIVMSGGAIGAMVLPPLAAALIAHHRLADGACLALGAMVLVDRPADGRFVHPRAAGSGRRDDRRARPARRCARASRSRVFWILVAVLFCSSIAQNGAITHMAALLTDRGRLGRRRRAGDLGDGRRQPGRPARAPAGCSIASSPRASSFALLAAAALGTFLLSTARSRWRPAPSPPR